MAAPANLSFTDTVREVFAEVTRYPWEILEPGASLEEDLGIDSVKLGEVFAVLRERYALPEKMDIPRENLRTIGSISQALKDHLVAQEVAPPVAQVILSPAGVAAPITRTAPAGDLLEEIRAIFADVTRYPLEILEPSASLEEDLGIDSVKLGEVFAVLRERYALPEALEVSREQVKTIAGIATALRSYIGAAQPAPAVPAAAPLVAQVILSPAGVAVDLTNTVRQVFADVTRYPLEILEPNASLEEDLGIDSVKLGEVFAVLRERYTLPEKMDLPREQLKSIAGVAEALRAYLGAPAVAPVVVKNGSNGFHPPTVAEPSTSASAVIDSSFAALTAQRKPFEGKIAYVSGSGRALGKDVAVYLAELGATVIVNSFHSREQGMKTVDEIKSAGGKAIHAWGSVANPQQLDGIFNQIESEFGGLDFFVSNASNGMLARLEDITVEHLEKAFRTNVIGLHQSALRARALMKKRGGGKIVTLSSPACHGYVDYFGCMGTVKAAVESLTKSMAIEFAADNIQVNCVSPGPIYGDLLDKWPESKRLIAQWEEHTAYERLCESRDVSHFIAYLLSDSVKLFTGAVLVMDGGISVRCM
ncbi:MAG TPA: SDR family oxidoreductase [Bryobacteraceae bacterium]|nr:SDR family oxidoreductase [Bryobacteraceae bacterium]